MEENASLLLREPLRVACQFNRGVPFALFLSLLCFSSTRGVEAVRTCTPRPTCCRFEIRTERPLRVQPPSCMRLRGGNDAEDNFWWTLREFLGARRDAGEPTLASRVLESLAVLPPTTRTLLLANVGVYAMARLGVLGPDPAERFGFKARGESMYVADLP